MPYRILRFLNKRDPTIFMLCAGLCSIFIGASLYWPGGEIYQDPDYRWLLYADLMPERYWAYVMLICGSACFVAPFFGKVRQWIAFLAASFWAIVGIMLVSSGWEHHRISPKGGIMLVFAVGCWLAIRQWQPKL